MRFWNADFAIELFGLKSSGGILSEKGGCSFEGGFIQIIFIVTILEFSSNRVFAEDELLL